MLAARLSPVFVPFSRVDDRFAVGGGGGGDGALNRTFDCAFEVRLPPSGLV